MKNLLTYIVVLAALVSCGRSEWLDLKPARKIIPSEVNDYRLILDQEAGGNSPGFQRTYSNTDYMSDDFIIPEEIGNRFFSNASLDQYTWNEAFFARGEAFATTDTDWTNLYGQIYMANVVIEEIMEAENGTMDEKLQLLAEARLQRAFSYFCLVNLYGLQYHPNTAGENPGVHFRLGTTTDLKRVDFSRASVQEIYDFILEEVNDETLSSLPESQPVLYRNRPSQASAHAFLARVHLYMGHYDKAKEAATNALDIQHTIIDLNAYEKGFAGVLSLSQAHEDEQVIWRKGNPESGVFGQILIASNSLYSLYTASDLRKHYYAPATDIFQSQITAPGLIALAIYGLNRYRPAGFTVPEVLLTKSECDARAGDAALAVEALNELRAKRFITGTYRPIPSNLSPEAALDSVKRERRLEFAGQGLRFFDLKRYNEFDNANITLTHELNGVTYTLPPGSKNWAVPIALKHIREAPALGPNVRD